jgi:prolyl oligopeptidase
MFGVEVTDDGRYLIITASPNCENVNRLYYVDLQNMEYESSGLKQSHLPYFIGILKPVKAIDNFEACYNYVANDGTLFYLQTNKDSPKYKIIQLDVAHPEKPWKEIIPEGKEPMKWIFCVNDHLVVCYMEDVKEALKCYTMEGSYLFNFSVPGIGSVSGASGKRSRT